MNKFITLLFIIMLSSCTTIRFSDGSTSVTAEKEQPFCNIEKVDPNCKIEGNVN